MITRQTPMNDDHGDQFPGALPAPAAAAPTSERHVRMRAAYVHKVNSAVQAGRDGLAHELAERTFTEEAAAGDAVRRPSGRRTPPRTPGGRAARRAQRWAGWAGSPAGR